MIEPLEFIPIYKGNFNMTVEEYIAEKTIIDREKSKRLRRTINSVAVALGLVAVSYLILAVVGVFN